MNNFTSFRVEIKRTESGDNIKVVDGKILTPRSKNFITIYADLPMKMRPKRNMFDENLADEMEEDRTQIRYIWFMLDQEEFELFARGPFSHTFEDGYHRMEVCGDSCLFYDSIRNQNIHRESHSKVEIAYFNANIPIFFRRYILRIARQIWRGLETAQHQAILASKRESWGHVEYSDREWSYNAPQVRLTISQKQREHFTKLYGQGKGQVQVDFGSYKPEETAEQIRIDSANENFLEQFNGKIQIARNSTDGFHQTARLFICRERDNGKDGISPGYFWQAYTPKGQTILLGGMYDHRRSPEEEQSWSSHT